MATQLGKLLRTGTELVAKASTGTLSDYVIAAPPQYGQPLPLQSDVAGAITPERMREIVLKTPTAAAACNAILDFATGVAVDVRNIDPAVPVNPARTKLIKSIMRKPNPQQTWRRWFRMLARDILTFGYAGVEVEYTAAGTVANLWVLDNARIRVDYNEHGEVQGYDMLNAYAMPIVGDDKVHAWKPNQVLWFVLDEQSNTLYGSSRIQQLFACGVLEAMMLNFIGGRFTDSNIPFGVIDLGDITDDELQIAIDSWNEQAAKSGDHRVVITGSRGGAKYFPFGYHLKDLEATNLLHTIRQQIMGILGVTSNELGESEDINKSNGYNLSFVFKKRAIEPLLDEITQTLTTFLLHNIMGLTELELCYAEIDSRDELLQAQIDDLDMKMGVVSINHIRNRKGLPDTAGGEEPLMWTGSDWIPVNLINEFALAQLRTMELMNEQMEVSTQMMLQAPQGGDGTDPKAGQAQVKPPYLRAPKQPERLHMMSGGSNAIRPRLPQPGQTKSETNSKRTRGAVQTLRNVGLRKEDTA